MALFTAGYYPDGAGAVIQAPVGMGGCPIALYHSGIRVNALSAGPMKTLAMAGISGGKDMMKWSEKNSLMLRNISLDDVGKSGLYLLSDLSSGVTGEVHYVDCGYSKVGVPREI